MNADRDPYTLREMSDEQLCKWIAGHNEANGLGYRLLGQHELQRRLRQPDAVRSWIAIGISIVAVLLSLAPPRQ